MDFHGVKMAVTHFVTQFIQFTIYNLQFIQFLINSKKKMFRETVLDMGSQICEQIVYVSTKLLLEKKIQKLRKP